MSDYKIAEPVQEQSSELELHMLLSCYEAATNDDKKVVWAVLSKYAAHVLF